MNKVVLILVVYCAKCSERSRKTFAKILFSSRQAEGHGQSSLELFHYCVLVCKQTEKDWTGCVKRDDQRVERGLFFCDLGREGKILNWAVIFFRSLWLLFRRVFTIADLSVWWKMPDVRELLMISVRSGSTTSRHSAGRRVHGTQFACLWGDLFTNSRTVLSETGWKIQK